MFKSKTTTPPTLEERLAGAAAIKGAALAVFEQAAADLDTAVEEADSVRGLAVAEIERLREIVAAADDESAAAYTAAHTIRATILGKA